MKSIVRFAVLLSAAYAGLVLLLGCASVQRRLLYFPSHLELRNGLDPWFDQHEIIGWTREVDHPRHVWLMLHGNGGQAAHRAYALPHFSPEDSVFILEYPGYGWRPGTPSATSFNAAAREAYGLLRQRFPSVPVCVVGESLGSGPACLLAQEPVPPDKLVLIVPFDVLARVAAEHYPFLPVRWLLKDNWNNIAALAAYRGPIDIFAGTRDTVIPSSHARALAASKPQARLTLFAGGHNDWAASSLVRITAP